MLQSGYRCVGQAVIQHRSKCVTTFSLLEERYMSCLDRSTCAHADNDIRLWKLSTNSHSGPRHAATLLSGPTRTLRCPSSRTPGNTSSRGGTISDTATFAPVTVSNMENRREPN